MLDYEVELGAFLGPGNPMGEPIPIAQADDHVVGVCLLNDWSARDIQSWEYSAAGPVLSEEFRHLDLSLGSDHGRARAVPHRCRTTAGGRPETAASSAQRPATAPSASRSKSGCDPRKCRIPCS